jgi:hypothetical protein
VPGVGPFHDPAAGLALQAKTFFFTTMSNVRPNSSSTNCSIYISIIVPFVETEIAWPARAT